MDLDVLRLTIAAILLVTAVLLVLKPGPIYWLSDQTNLRNAKWWAKRGWPRTLERYDVGVTALRIAIPLVIAFVAIAVAAPSVVSQF